METATATATALDADELREPLQKSRTQRNAEVFSFQVPSAILGVLCGAKTRRSLLRCSATGEAPVDLHQCLGDLASAANQLVLRDEQGALRVEHL